MCKDINEALMEDMIEITWMFDGLMQSGEIRQWDDLIDEYGSDGIKVTIKHIAHEFEKKYPYETTWIDTDLDYIEEIEKFAKEKLLEEFGYEEYAECEPDMVDGVTACCGYDFGTDMNNVKFCPVCGKYLKNIK